AASGAEASPGFATTCPVRTETSTNGSSCRRSLTYRGRDCSTGRTSGSRRTRRDSVPTAMSSWSSMATRSGRFIARRITSVFSKRNSELTGRQTNRIFAVARDPKLPFSARRPAFPLPGAHHGRGTCLSFDLLARLTHRADESDRQFVNPVRLAQFDGFFRDKVRAYADRGSARQNEVGDVQLVHTAGGNQRHLWKRRLERFDVRGAAELGAWEDLDEVDTGFPRHHHLGGGERAGEDDCILVVRKFDGFEIEPGGGQKLRSRIQTAARSLHIPDRACAHDE